MVWALKDEWQQGPCLSGQQKPVNGAGTHAMSASIIHAHMSTMAGSCRDQIIPQHVSLCRARVFCGHFEPGWQKHPVTLPLAEGPSPACLEWSACSGFESRVALEALSTEVSLWGRTGSGIWWGPGSPRTGGSHPVILWTPENLCLPPPKWGLLEALVV